MHRFAASLIILSLAAPALAETKRQRAKRCAAQADIVQKAVDQRQEDKTAAKASEAITAETDKRIAASVAPLVGYVYALPEADLAQDIRTAFEEQCNGFKP